MQVGRTTIVVETELTNDDPLVAKLTQTQAVLQPRWTGLAEHGRFAKASGPAEASDRG